MDWVVVVGGRIMILDSITFLRRSGDARAIMTVT